MTTSPPPLKHLADVHPHCEHCGADLKIKVLGLMDPDDDDVTQVTFQLPAPHKCVTGDMAG